MTNPNNPSDSPEPEYPVHFDPDKFAHPEIFLNVLTAPGVIIIGEEVESVGDIERLNEEEGKRFGWHITPLYLSHAKGRGRSIFPVYKIAAESTLSGSDGSTYHLRTAQESKVQQEHLLAAEQYVESTTAHITLTSEQTRRMITRAAIAIASGAELPVPGEKMSLEALMKEGKRGNET